MNHQDAKSAKSTKESELPALLWPLFWDYDFKTLTWDDDRDLIIARVLASGLQQEALQKQHTLRPSWLGRNWM